MHPMAKVLNPRATASLQLIRNLAVQVAGEYAHMQLHLCKRQVLELAVPFA